MTGVPNFLPALPEILIACGGMLLLMLGVFRRSEPTEMVGWLAVTVLVAAILIISVMPSNEKVTFNNLFLVNAFTSFVKIITLIGSVLTLILTMTWAKNEGVARFELPVLIVFATLGMMLMISANGFIAAYVGLEMQSLSLYVLAAFHRGNTRATEAGVKYFVLGALASGLLLYGASLVYGFSGTTTFDGLAIAFRQGGINVGVTVGMVFIVCGFAFKMSAVPFHMWTPDVYEGAPTPVTAFFSVAPKIAALALFSRVLAGPFEPMMEQWQQVLLLICVASMLWGAFAAIAQTNIKRLLAYSSIGHVGYALVGLVVGTQEGARGLLFYMLIYLFMNVGTFACILSMRVKGRYVEDISDLSGIAKKNPAIALALAVLMFSMAGIPPLAGFFGKFYIFVAAVNADMVPLAVIGVLASVVAAYYYLHIVKVIYFDEPAKTFDRPDLSTGLIMGVCSFLMLIYFIIPAPLIGGAETAAAALSLG